MLLARAAVNALAEQVHMADVAGVFLDEVDDDVARFELLAVEVDEQVEIQAGVESPSMCHFTSPGVPRISNDRIVTNGLVKSRSGSTSVR